MRSHFTPINTAESHFQIHVDYSLKQFITVHGVDDDNKVEMHMAAVAMGGSCELTSDQ